MTHIFAIEDAHIAIGGNMLFNDLNFHIHPQSKIALVGKNGSGKTTLMHVIAGFLPLEDGELWTMPGTTINLMAQHTASQNITIIDYMNDNSNINDDEHYKIDQILADLRLDPQATMTSLSGGQLRRVSLASALLCEPDILLLDEPTNHMDIGLIEWLENTIARYKGAVIMISHDKEFLRNASDKVFWIDRGNLRSIPCGYGEFETWSKEELEHEARSLDNRKSRVALEMSWAQKGVKARVKRNQRRLQQAYEERDRLEKDVKSFRTTQNHITLPPLKAEQASDIIADMINVSLYYGEHTILEKFNYRIKRNSRIGIIGANGSGKSSFLKLLLGLEKPDNGKIKLAKNAEYQYFSQQRDGLNLDKTVQENLCPPHADHLMVRGKSRHVCGYIKDFMFDPKDAFRPVSTLSGGQQNKLLLAKIFAQPGQILILDEPTNDLDSDTLDMLVHVLRDYNGTLIIVSHDRDFLNKTINKLLIFEGHGTIIDIVGTYKDYQQYRRAQQLSNTQPQTDNMPDNSTSSQPLKNDKNIKKDTTNIPKKISYKIQYEWQHLPQKLEEIDQQLKLYEKQLADASFYMNNPDDFDKVSQHYMALKQEKEQKEERWIELADIMDNV